MTAHLAVFICYCIKNNIKEELISLISLKTTIKGIEATQF